MKEDVCYFYMVELGSAGYVESRDLLTSISVSSPVSVLERYEDVGSVLDLLSLTV